MYTNTLNVLGSHKKSKCFTDDTSDGFSNIVDILISNVNYRATPLIQSNIFISIIARHCSLYLVVDQHSGLQKAIGRNTLRRILHLKRSLMCRSQRTLVMERPSSKLHWYHPNETFEPVVRNSFILIQSRTVLHKAIISLLNKWLGITFAMRS